MHTRPVPTWRKPALLLAFAIAAGLSTAAHCTQEITCPSELPATSIQLQNPPPGWEFFVESPLYLHAAEPMTGPPNQLGHLVEDSVKKTKQETVYIYTLDGPLPGGKWIQCSYGAHSELTLSRRINDSVKRCTIRYRKGTKAERNEIRINCE